LTEYLNYKGLAMLGFTRLTAEETKERERLLRIKELEGLLKQEMNIRAESLVKAEGYTKELQGIVK